MSFDISRYKTKTVVYRKKIFASLNTLLSYTTSEAILLSVFVRWRFSYTVKRVCTLRVWYHAVLPCTPVKRQTGYCFACVSLCPRNKWQELSYGRETVRHMLQYSNLMTWGVGVLYIVMWLFGSFHTIDWNWILLKNKNNTFLSHPLGDFGVTYTLHR